MNTGPKVKNEGLVLALDAASIRSTSKSDQKFNLLPDAGNWTTGTGGQTGYSVNGSSSEQNRLLVSDDPWGRSSVTWRTTPDSTSGADGGWNTSFYSCDRTKTYRMSVWVRRYTSGTGGTFYFGLYFSPTNTPMRVDNGALQSNPYFTYPAQSSLELDQWYLVVYHVHPYGYDRTEGDHPDTGWYKNGKRISALSSGNTVGDVVFLSDTTSIKHRTYHYYTTNTSSGLEFADPRIEVLTPKTPKVRHLIKKGASGWKDLKSKTSYNIPAGMQFTGYDKQSSFDFDGTDDHINLPTSLIDNLDTTQLTVEAVVYHTSWGTVGGSRPYVANWNTWSPGNQKGFILRTYTTSQYPSFWYCWGANYTSITASTQMNLNQYYHVVGVFKKDSYAKIYVNGVEAGSTTTGTGNNLVYDSSTGTRIGYGTINTGRMVGNIPIAKIYNQALSADEVKQNFNAYRRRFNL